MSRARRRHVYEVARVLLPILVALGYLTDSFVPLIVAALGTILVPDLALRNVPTDDDA